ncbi:MAG: hypothetical protein ACRDGV_06960, partial [Candidatus Limnocylindria bacterium]
PPPVEPPPIFEPLATFKLPATAPFEAPAPPDSPDEPESAWAPEPAWSPEPTWSDERAVPVEEAAAFAEPSPAAEAPPREELPADTRESWSAPTWEAAPVTDPWNEDLLELPASAEPAWTDEPRWGVQPATEPAPAEPALDEPEPMPIPMPEPEPRPIPEPEPEPASAAPELEPATLGPRVDDEAAEEFEAPAFREVFAAVEPPPEPVTVASVEPDMETGEQLDRTKVYELPMPAPPPDALAPWDREPEPFREPERDLQPVSGAVWTTAGTGAEEWNGLDRRHVSGAEQAVPWLIGGVMFLAGLVIVLLALIFAGDASVSGGLGSSPLADATPSIEPTPEPTPSASVAVATPTAAPLLTPTPAPVPEYGPLEMVYQGRSAALAPIYLLRRDFTSPDEPQVLAQDPSLNVGAFAWAPDGTVGSALLADRLVSIEPSADRRSLADGITTVTFGDNASTVYAVRIREDGADDTATILAIGFASGETDELATVTYARPEVGSEPELNQAQFLDEGGVVRLFWMDGGGLRLWVFGRGTWDIDPEDGEVTEGETDEAPVLWAPDGSMRVMVSESGTASTLVLYGEDGDQEASTSVAGLVSHVRWSPDSSQVAFTLGTSAAAGGVLQNLHLWNLDDAAAPMQLTTTGAAFGVEWLGSKGVWRP